MVEIFNTKDMDESLPESLVYEDALKGHYFGMNEAPIAGPNDSVPFYLKEQAVDLFCHHSRAFEERCLLLKKMVNVDRVFRKQQQVLLACATSDYLSQGQMEMVVAKAISKEELHNEFYEACKGNVELPFPGQTFIASVINNHQSITTSELGLPEEEVSDFLERVQCLEEEQEQHGDDGDDHEIEDGLSAVQESDYLDLIDL
ncbi:uncharacterized protein LOC135498876 isoform X1 [Lineus longissimus]|uniref:uncharacterized protein LOC135498876 isoform X1 n=1 Tax=Lineus longissimus TaxID=88925 RepID=UPI002B4CFC38